jgi:hypothetical protein
MIYVSVFLFCFMCILFIVQCCVCLDVVLFLLRAIWLLIQHVNKQEIINNNHSSSNNNINIIIICNIIIILMIKKEYSFLP